MHWFCKTTPAAAAITAIVGGAAIGGIMQANISQMILMLLRKVKKTPDYGGVTGDPVAGALVLVE